MVKERTLEWHAQIMALLVVLMIPFNLFGQQENYAWEPIKIKSIGAEFDKHFRFIRYDIEKGHDYRITLVPFSDDLHPDFPQRKASNYNATINSLYVSRGGVRTCNMSTTRDDRLQTIFDGKTLAAGNSFFFKASVKGKGLQLYSNFEVTLLIEDVTYGDRDMYPNYDFPLVRVGAIDKSNVLKDFGKNIYTDYQQVRIPNVILLNNGKILVFSHSPRLLSVSDDGGRTFRLEKEKISTKWVLGQSVCYDKINNAIFTVDINEGRITRSIDNGNTFDDYGVLNDKTPTLQHELDRLRIEENKKAMAAIAKGDNPQRYYYTIYECSGPGLGIQLTNGVLAIPVCSWVRKIKAQLSDETWKGETNKQGYMMKGGYPYRRDVDYNDLSLFSQTDVSINYILYSKDFGATWIKSVATPSDVYVNELSIAEVEENQIMINARGGSEAFYGFSRNGRRILIPTNSQVGVSRKNYTIDDWQLDSVSDGKLWDPLCHAAFAKIDYHGHTFWLFCNPYINGQNEYNPRSNLMLQVSSDARHWSKVGLVSPYGRHIEGYCSIQANKNKIGLVYEGDGTNDRGIYYVDLTEYMIERILLTYIMNKQIYSGLHEK